MSFKLFQLISTHLNKSQIISKYLNLISTHLNKSQSISRLSNNRGVALILVAGALVLLIALAALAIDIAYMYFVKNELQVAADASALAGAARLTGLIDSGGTVPAELEARKEAWKFACKNKAAGSNVYLVTNSSTNCDSPPSTGLNEGNDPNGDIVIGNWNQSTRTFTPATGNTGLAINAIKVIPKRTSQSASYGMPPVSIFFGRVIGWNVMSAQAEAIATKGVPPGKGISICLRTCNLDPSDSNPINLDVREQTKDSPYGLAWTQFDTSSPIGTQTCIGNNCNKPLDADCATDNGKRVAAIIWGLVSPPNVCGQSITTQNGVANVLDDLGCAFKSTSYDTDSKIIESGVVKKWKVIVPVQEECPAGSEPGPWPVIRYAQIEISGVFDTGTLKGIKITKIKCVECGNLAELGFKGAALVK